MKREKKKIRFLCVRHDWQQIICRFSTLQIIRSICWPFYFRLEIKLFEKKIQIHKVDMLETNCSQDMLLKSMDRNQQPIFCQLQERNMTLGVKEELGSWSVNVCFLMQQAAINGGRKCSTVIYFRKRNVFFFFPHT